MTIYWLNQPINFSMIQMLCVKLQILLYYDVTDINKNVKPQIFKAQNLSCLFNFASQLSCITNENLLNKI